MGINGGCHRSFLAGLLGYSDTALNPFLSAVSQGLAPVMERFSPFAEFIADERDLALLDGLRRAETIGRPIGDDAFIMARSDETHAQTRQTGRNRRIVEYTVTEFTSLRTLSIRAIHAAMSQ